MADKHKDWQQEVGFASRSQFKKFNRNHPAEYASCFTNLGILTRVLNAGHKVGGFDLGFFRSEGGGLYRIGQSGVVAAKETRLYVYPDEEAKLIYVLGIGTKETQQNDIKSAKKQIRKINAAGEPNGE
jgi:hypothetical protein